MIENAGPLERVSTHLYTVFFFHPQSWQEAKHFVSSCLEQRSSQQASLSKAQEDLVQVIFLCY